MNNKTNTNPTEVIVRPDWPAVNQEKHMSNEYLIDMVNRIPGAGPGTDLGFIMGLGLVNEGTEFRSVKEPTRKRGGAVVGGYFPKGEQFTKNNKYLGRMFGDNTITPYLEGETDVLYTTPQHVLDEIKSRDSEESIFTHELFHKGAAISMPVIDDMLEEKGGLFKLMRLQKSKLRDFKESFNKDRHHNKYLKAMDKFYNVKGDVSKLSKKEIETLQEVAAIGDAVRFYLTDDKKEKYGIKTPLKESKPKKKSLFDRFLK